MIRSLFLVFLSLFSVAKCSFSCFSSPMNQRIVFHLEYFEKNCERINKFAGKERKVMIPTEFEGAMPICISNNEKTAWDRTTDFLKNWGDNFYFGGGFLDLDEPEDFFDRLYDKLFGETYLGCLGYAYMQLKKRRINGEFVKGCCFTRDA